jgi:UDP-glucuronate 4-epimerase
VTGKTPTEGEDGRVILVTGARGFVGRAVCKLLQRLSYAVVALDRAQLSGKSSFSESSEIEADIVDRAKLQKLFATKNITGVIHLAAILPTAAGRDPVRATEVNIQGSVNLLQVSQQFGVKRFVFGSSLSVYGTCPPDEFVSETYRAAPEDLYGAAKSYVEQLGQSYQEHHNLQFVSLRIGRVIGPGARSTTSRWRSEIFERLSTQDAVEIRLPYLGSERLLVVHVDDVARMLIALMDAPPPKFCIYNSVCESLVVEDLKRQVEAINPRVQVRLGNESASGNPRLLDCSRFRSEFGFETRPIFDVLREEADGTSA